MLSPQSDLFGYIKFYQLPHRWITFLLQLRLSLHRNKTKVSRRFVPSSLQWRPSTLSHKIFWSELNLPVRVALRCHWFCIRNGFHFLMKWRTAKHSKSLTVRARIETRDRELALNHTRINQLYAKPSWKGLEHRQLASSTVMFDKL